MTLTAAAIFIPEKINGNAPGNRTFQKPCHHPARRSRMRSSSSGSVASNPSTELTTIGKKAIRAVMITLGIRSYPNQTMSNGAMAMTGTVWDAMTNG